MLETAREMKSIGVDIWFEEQNIHTMSADGELMLTILASYYQEESLSVSENCKWRIRRRFADGEIVGLNFMFGYNIADGKIQKDSEQAEVVEMMYSDYISGMGSMQIAKKLTAMGVPTYFGGKWNCSRVIDILKNEKYTGSALLQKTFISDHLTKRKTKNRGELPQYYAEATHPAIVSNETFERAQQIMAERKDYYKLENRSGNVYPFTGKIVCGRCGKSYRRKTTVTQITWQCATYLQHGKSACHAKQIPERVLYELSADVLGIDEFDARMFADEIEQIRVPRANHVTFVFTDGHTIEKKWNDRSRGESWTAEMREAARERGVHQWQM